MQSTKPDCIVLIPAYNPGIELITLLEGLAVANLPVVVVDDGSGPACADIMDRVRQCHATVLRHKTNLGKGAALKTGMEYIIERHADRTGIVCADADGQHAVNDILNIGCALESTPHALVIGTREFRADIPWRSRIGNLLTRRIFNLLTGLKLSDTQSGLRGIPMGQVREYLEIRTRRYEFELEQLIRARQYGHPVRQVPIDTIYVDSNKSSHFKPFMDSVRIYFVLFRFGFSSAASALIDYGMFMLGYTLTRNLWVSQYGARLISGSFNYTINRNLVFRSRAKIPGSLARYIALAVILAYGSLLIIKGMVHLGVHVALAKPLAESMLFSVSFLVQRNFILKN